MHHTTLVFPTQTWNGPKGSTFSPDWNGALTSCMLAPCPDVIRPPPSCQSSAGTYTSPGPDSHAPNPKPLQSITLNSSSIPSSTTRGVDKETGADERKDRRSRAAGGMEVHRRSASLSTAVTANPHGTRRRCESYALSYPSSSSEDSGSDSTSQRRGDHLPDAVPQSHARTIILRKAKKTPAPPVRTVSLQRLTDLAQPERRTRSLYIPQDAQFNTFLPDLIPIPKLEDDNNKESISISGMPTKVPVKQTISCHRPLNELRSSEPCRLQFSSGQPAVGDVVQEGTRVPSTCDFNNSPSSSRSSPSQPSVSSPKLTGSSPSSGYSSQCETPTPSVITSVITGPSPLGCRMRPKPSNSGPNQRARGCRARLSLQLPETQQPPSDPCPDQPKVSRRHSDASATTRPKQRMSNSMLVMPFVTQEDLDNVRLRSVSSSDPENARESISEVIEEETERDSGLQVSQQSPKFKPPVAPKPHVTKRPVISSAISHSGPPCGSDSLAGFIDGQGNSYIVSNKSHPNITNRCPSDISRSQGHHGMVQQTFFGSQPEQPFRDKAEPQSQQNWHSLSRPGPNCNCEAQKKTKAPPPPVPRKPDVAHTPADGSSCFKSSDKHVQSSPDCSSKHLGSPRDLYHVTIYGVIPTDHHPSGESQMDASVEYITYDKAKVSQLPDVGNLNLVEEEDDVFVHKPTSHTTEDLFTIIHRSKRKLLGRKDSIEHKQGDFGTMTLGGVSKSSSQNDNFMALLRRTRSARAGSGGRISAAELLKSSKPPVPLPSELTQFK